MMDWQPAHTAPTEGETIWLKNETDGTYCMAYFMHRPPGPEGNYPWVTWDPDVGFLAGAVMLNEDWPTHWCRIKPPDDCV